MPLPESDSQKNLRNPISKSAFLEGSLARKEGNQDEYNSITLGFRVKQLQVLPVQDYSSYIPKDSKWSLDFIVSDEDDVPQATSQERSGPPPPALPAEQSSRAHTGLKLPNPIFRWLPKAG